MARFPDRGLNGRRSVLPLLIGGVLALAALALLPIVLLIEQSLTDALVADHVAVEVAAERQRLGLFKEEVQRAEASVLRLARAVSSTEAELSREAVPLAARVERDADGSRRTPRGRFDPATQAGIWVPPSSVLGPTDERFFVRSERVIGLFGLGAYNNLFFDTWLLPLTNGEVTFGPELPEFIYDATAEQDYRDTEWVQLTNPATNPTGLPRWTPPSYDPVAKHWMISVVAPVTIDGRWSGSVGHDLLLTTMLRTFLPADHDGMTHDGALHVVAGPELLVASSTFGAMIERAGGALKVADTGNAHLAARVAEARQKLAEGDGRDTVVWLGQGDYVLATRLAMMDGVVLRTIPAAAIERQLQRPLTLLRGVLFSSMALTMGLVLALVLREERRRRLLETALREQNAQLEQHVAERMEELRTANEALRASKETAEAAARSKSEFLAVMSHEIRTPMNGVLGMTRLVLGGELPEAARERLDVVVSSAESLLTILDDILDLSKLEAGRLEFEHAAFRLRPLLAGIVELMQNRAREKGLVLLLEVADDLPEAVAGDPVRLRQVVLNLVGNALKFSDRGSVRLRVGRRDGAQMLFEVIDTGIGMDAQTAARVFDAFTQADASTSRRYGGTGLGLAICKRLIEGQGGSIGVDSTPGRGSRFWFLLPLTEAAPPPETVVVLPATPLPPLSILLAEDNEVNRLVALGFLQRNGHRVATAFDGRAAVELARAGGFDVVLMDMQMPEMDGLEATRAIRALPPPAGLVPVIALTANAMSADIARCFDAGMNDHVAKPLDPMLLNATIARVLGLDDLAKPQGTQALLPHLGPDSTAQMLELFLHNGGGLVERMVALASGGGEAAEIAPLAHDLKGMSAYFGGTQLAQATAQVEAAAAADGRDFLAERGRRLQAVWEQIRADLQGDLARLRQPAEV
ncbi:MAG: ATP-binding protein [Bacteroidota bacterium]